MTDDGPADRQAVFEALADPDCRDILATLDEPLPAQAVADACDLSQTSAYRKLERLADAGLLAEGTGVRADGHHVTTYERDCSGVWVAVEDERPFDVEVLRERESPDERLARLWQEVSEEV
ncbi:winged helix-turn-helix domain-containing protein [Halomicrobium salinisoli]|uniref:winged helix-turn-helix domain-containing protein n=1 Tax=Halomicrobium salinisoli TaxID=2878391 RepID=UPI001CF0C818|nr:helix-turn-helix domain-containing protein [Halomicrobium salinisoli]